MAFNFAVHINILEVPEGACDCYCSMALLTVTWVWLQGVIVIFPDYTHLHFRLNVISLVLQDN